MNPQRRAERERLFNAYERRATVPLLVVGLVFVSTFVVQLTDPDAVSRFLFRASWVIFIIDYVIMVILSPNRLRFITGNLLYLVALILPPIRIYVLVLLAYRATVSKNSPLRDRVGLLTVYVTTLIIVFGALLTWGFERDAPGANIRTYGESLWWAIVSITTVGYGDFTPVTVPGRIVATLVFFTGIGALAVLTAIVVSFFTGDAWQERLGNITERQANRPAKRPVSEQGVDLTDVETRLAAIETILRNGHSSSGDVSSSDPEPTLTGETRSPDDPGPDRTSGH